ncbi:MAG: hypothetical protein LBF15_06635 [Candidatus Peribacteria bacterium]|nr:hypothetical protein [Candidatus Peribacteria bacterium]
MAIFALLTQIIMPSISFAADIPLSSSDVFLCNGGDCIGATSSLNYYTTTGVTLVSAVEDDVTNNVTITLS